MSVESVLRQAESLPVEDRVELVCRIWDGIAGPGWVPELSDELRAELDRRIADADANPDDVYTWDEVVAYVKRKR